MNRKTLLLITVVLLVIFASPYFIAKLIYQMDKIQVNISLSQATANVTMNGQVVKPGTIYLSPGKYVVSATLSGYSEYRKVYEIDSANNDISIDLSKISTQTIDQVLAGPDGYKIVTDKYPIIIRLPYRTALLKVDYSEDSTLDSLTIIVDAPEGYRSAIVSKIKSWGYNPADYNITFKDYRNPFAL